MKKFRIFPAVLVVLSFVFVVSCQKETNEIVLDRETNVILKDLPMNPTLDELGTIPVATVPLLDFPEALPLKDAPIPSSLEPEVFEPENTFQAGESVSETKIAFIDGAPPKGDVLFMMDLTGSMGGELSNAEANSINIMNGIGSVIADASFGLVSHMDYPDFYSWCGYSDLYGSAGDYPYQLDQEITADKNLVSAALNALSLGSGADGPEDYTRVLYETTADENIGWRTGARKFVVAWLDAPPHDCGYGTGADPGRDEVMGTGDDLETILPVLNEMKNQNITLIVLCSSPSCLSNWQDWAQVTGGDAFQINYDGTIPGGTDIATYITDLIEEQTGTINDLAVEVCTPGFEAWLTGAPTWTDVDLTEPFEDEFDITFTVPEGTEDGVYEFDVCLIGDGAEYGSQHVVIEVLNFIPVLFDVVPDPLNRENKGVTPMVIFGAADYDVADINVETLQIEGVHPVRWNYTDVNSDGMTDLTLKFDTKEFGPLFAWAEIGDVVVVTINGELLDGTPVIGEDVITIVK